MSNTYTSRLRVAPGAVLLADACRYSYQHVGGAAAERHLRLVDETSPLPPTSGRNAGISTELGCRRRNDRCCWRDKQRANKTNTAVSEIMNNICTEILKCLLVSVWMLVISLRAYYWLSTKAALLHMALNRLRTEKTNAWMDKCTKLFNYLLLFKSTRRVALLHFYSLTSILFLSLHRREQQTAKLSNSEIISCVGLCCTHACSGHMCIHWFLSQLRVSLSLIGFFAISNLCDHKNYIFFSM